MFRGRLLSRGLMMRLRSPLYTPFSSKALAEWAKSFIFALEASSWYGAQERAS